MHCFSATVNTDPEANMASQKWPRTSPRVERQSRQASMRTFAIMVYPNDTLNARLFFFSPDSLSLKL